MRHATAPVCAIEVADGGGQHAFRPLQAGTDEAQRVNERTAALVKQGAASQAAADQAHARFAADQGTVV